MKKAYKIENLCCAHCAQKLENGILKIDGVLSGRVNFLTQKLIIEAEDKKFDSVLQEVKKLAKKIEPDCEIL